MRRRQSATPRQTARQFIADSPALKRPPAPALHERERADPTALGRAAHARQSLAVRGREKAMKAVPRAVAAARDVPAVDPDVDVHDAHGAVFAALDRVARGHLEAFESLARTHLDEVRARDFRLRGRVPELADSPIAGESDARKIAVLFVDDF
ncbi:hypothetical protein ANO14919_101600 [Xylariales sp. No.14919]|nr:hypothetical protein ANO14919_101600 [Xylariales sp. No.14919]